MTIKQKQKQCLEDEEHSWILGKLEIALIKTEDQDVSIAIYMDIWQKNAESQGKIKR